MIEELIRIEHGRFLYEETEFYFDVGISCGESIGIYVDNHRTSGTAFMGIFSGKTGLCGGKAFTGGRRCGYAQIAKWIRANTVIIDRNRFTTRELTAADYLRINGRGYLPEEKKELRSAVECRNMWERMQLSFSIDTLLADLSMLDYYRLAAYSAWFYRSRVVVLDRMTEILRQQDLRLFMDCISILMELGAAAVLLDLDEHFLFRYAGRMDIMKNRRLCYRLYPEEYGEKLYEILEWTQTDPADTSSHAHLLKADSVTGYGCQERIPAFAEGPGYREAASAFVKFPGYMESAPVFTVRGLCFDGLDPMDFQLFPGEIGVMQDENYRTASCVRECFLGKGKWNSGSVALRGKTCTSAKLRKMVGRQIAVQIEMPDRPGGALFENLSALENLSTSLIPKAGKKIIQKDLMQNILQQAREWFDDALLEQPIRRWPLQQRLRLAYYKWYLMNPALMICFFPFRGQETNYHALIAGLLARCAERGIAIWIISSDIHAIREQADDPAFQERLRFLD